MSPEEQTLESLLPKRVLERLEPPDRARSEKVATRFSAADFEALERLALERGETVSAVVRKLALAAMEASAPGPDGPAERAGAPGAGAEEVVFEPPPALAWSAVETRLAEIPEELRREPSTPEAFKNAETLRAAARELRTDPKQRYDRIVGGGDSDSAKLAKLGDLLIRINDAVRTVTRWYCACMLEKCLDETTAPAECHAAYHAGCERADRAHLEFENRQWVARGARFLTLPTADYNCLGLIFGQLTGQPWALAYPDGLPGDRAQVKRLTVATLERLGFARKRRPRDCAVVLYLDKLGMQIHIGVLVNGENETVLSKWGQGATPMMVHPLRVTPYAGRTAAIEFWCPTGSMKGWCRPLKRRFGLEE